MFSFGSFWPMGSLSGTHNGLKGRTSPNPMAHGSSSSTDSSSMGPPMQELLSGGYPPGSGPLLPQLYPGTPYGLPNVASPPPHSPTPCIASSVSSLSWGAGHSTASTSPGGPGGRDGSLDSVSSAGLAHGGWRSGVSSGDGGCGVGGMAGVLGGGGSGGARTAGLTMKEYDQHLARLNKENFALKLRVYFLEEKQGQAGQAAPQLYKTNIELKVDNETLKRQLFDKQQLLSQASSALSQLEDDYKDQLNGLLQEHEARVQEMQDAIVQLQKTADDHATRCQELEATLRDQQQLIASSRGRHPAMSELSQLCDLAFPTSEGGTAAGGVGGPLSSAGGFQGEENEGSWNNTALWNMGEAPATSVAPASIWSTNTSTASLWGDCAPIMQMSAAVNNKMAGEDPRASSGEPRTNSRSSVDSGKDEEELHRKMSSDSQDSQSGSYCGGESASIPVQFTSANVTNNNINNTLPSSNNNLQQLQYQQQQQQHPSPYQNQDNTPTPPLMSSAQPQHFHHHHHHHNQEGGPRTSNPSPNVVVVNAGGHDVGAPPLTGHGDSGRQMPSGEEASLQHVREGQTAAAGMPSLSPLSGVSGQCCDSISRVPQLKVELSALQLRVQQLELQLLDKQRHSQALQEDLNNLRKELAEKESEVLDREEKVESLSQELETRHRQLQNREDTIHTLHSDLNRVEPEISVKVQEIVERDRIIEEKIEQLEQQNKILVEIQITLDEKQKQIAELESNLAEARERVTALERDFDKSCGAINGFIADLSTKDKEIATLKKEAKRRDRKIADLVAELKETLDMLGKAKWEAETGGCGEDSVKEMVEEENERLWAEIERKKLELQNLRTELNKAAEKADQENSSLNGQLSSCQETLRLKEDAEQRWKEEMAELVNALRTREAVMEKQRGDSEAQKVELEGVRLELQEKKMELDNALKTTAVSRDEITLPSTSAVEEQQRQLDVLRHQLETCREDYVREVQVLKGQLELKNSDILHLQSTILSAPRPVESRSCGGSSSSSAAAVAVVGDTNVATNRVEIADNRSSPHASSTETAVGIRYEPLQVSITTGLLSTNLGQQPAATEARSGDPGLAAMQSRLLQDGAREQATKADPGGRLTQADDAVDRNTIARIHEQIENLRSELKTTNKVIAYQASEEVAQRNYPQIVKKYRSECSRLRKRLGESNNACELLRNRLEELAEFLEQILDMDERGLIDLSKISGFAKANLYKSLNDSRALSQTLSMSVLAGMDTLLEEGFELDEINLEMLEEDTGKSFMPEDSLYQHCDATNMTLASSIVDDSCVSSLAWDSLLPDLSNEGLKVTNYKLLAKNVCQDVEAKAKKLDDILMQMANLSGNLDRKEMNAIKQAHVIQALQDKVSTLEDVLDSQKPLHENVRSIVTPEKQLETDAGDLVEVACQTLLAMAPRQSVSSLADLSTPYLSSCSESLAQSSANMDPVIEEPPILVDELETAVSEAMNALSQKDAATIQLQESVASSLLSPLSVVVAPRSGVDTGPTLSDSKKATANTAIVKSGCVSADEAQPLPHRVTASPSESEAWSEPDRNVSLARIGLETCTLAASLDRSLSRSRQTRASAALSSESDTEECLALPEDNSLSLLSIAPSASATPLVGATLPKYLPKRKSDASEVRRLNTKLRTLEHLNETLKAELNIYQSLSYQLSPTTDQQQSDHKLSSPSSNNSAIKSNSTACSAAIAHNSNASCVAYASINSNNTGSTANGTILTSNAVTSAAVTSGASVRVTASSCSSSLPLVSASKKLRRFTTSGEDSLALAAPLLQEIRSLRTKLEESISNNDQLRDQLEAAVLSCSRSSDDPSHLTHLTAALLNAQETLQLTREKLAFAQRCEQVQADRCALAERRTEEEAKVCYELRSQLQDTQQQVVAAVAQVEVNEVKWTKHSQDLKEKCEVSEKRLQEAKRMHEASELMLQERLEEVTRACEESEVRLKAQHDAIDEVYSSLQETSHWPHLSHLHSALQASETQVLKVTRDRLVLLGEKSKLQAQLMSAQAQTSLLQDSLCEEEVSQPQKPLLHQQLAQVQSAVKNLHEQCARLHATNASISRERDSLQEKVLSYKAFEKLANKPDITLETVNPSDVARGEKNAGETRRLNSVAFQQLQRNHSLLQEDYTHLQQLYNLLQDDEKRSCQKLHLTNTALHKAQLNIDGLTEQYQDKMQLLQKECNDKLIEAERQVNEVQARFQERLKTSEEKLAEVQQRCNETLTQMKRSYSSEVAKLEEQLRHLLQQLDSERKLGDDLRSEMRKLKLSATQDRSWSEDNKENLGSTRLHCSLSPKSPLRQSIIKSSILSTGHGGYINRSTIDSHSPVSETLGGSLLRLSCGHTRNSGRSLHFSDPNLGPGIAYTTEEDEEDIRGVCNSDSPDLGLGSSDNGQMSSLERVMGHRAASHTISSARAGSLATSGNNALGRPGGANDTLLFTKHNNQYGYSKQTSLPHLDLSKGSIDEGRRSSLLTYSPSKNGHHPISVLITERSPQPATSAADASSDPLCSVTSHVSLASSNEQLNREVRTLRERLSNSDARLMEAERQLAAANARKQTVERAICRQLSKTHQVLKRAKGNLQQHSRAGEPASGAAAGVAATDRHSSVD